MKSRRNIFRTPSEKSVLPKVNLNKSRRDKFLLNWKYWYIPGRLGLVISNEEQQLMRGSVSKPINLNSHHYHHNWVVQSLAHRPSVERENNFDSTIGQPDFPKLKMVAGSNMSHFCQHLNGGLSQEKLSTKDLETITCFWPLARRCGPRNSFEVIKKLSLNPLLKS